MMKKAICLFLIGSAAHASQLNQLIDASTEIVNQLDTGIIYTGTATSFAYTGTGMSDGTLSDNAKISARQVKAYNDALSGMASYLPYGSVSDVLEQKASHHIALMEDSVEAFTGAVVELSTTIQVQEMAQESVGNPAEEEQVQEFVVQNEGVLAIQQDTVDTYNESLDSIESNANTAAAFISVAANEEAVAFLEQGAVNNNSVADEAIVTYSAEQQWVSMQWAGTNNATAVYLNGQNFGLDMYMTEADIYAAGQETEFYLTGPTAQGYNCFMYGTDCSYESIGN